MHYVVLPQFSYVFTNLPFSNCAFPVGENVGDGSGQGRLLGNHQHRRRSHSVTTLATTQTTVNTIYPQPLGTIRNLIKKPR